MTAELYNIITIVCFSVGGLLFALAVFLFIYYKIPKTIGDITGTNAKRAIENIQVQNESLSGMSGTLDGKKHKKANSKKPVAAGAASANKYKTGKITTTELEGSETTVLDNSSETTVLDNSSETTVLGSTSETTVLGKNPYDNNQNPIEISNEKVYNRVANGTVTVQFDITFMHSNEIIR